MKLAVRIANTFAPSGKHRNDIDAAATLPGSGNCEGTGSPSTRRSSRPRTLLAVLALALAAAALAAAPASAALSTASVDSITKISYTSAHIKGTVHPVVGTNGEGTYWRIDYSPDGVHWIENTVHGGPLVADPSTIEAELQGLKGGTEYFVRIGLYNGEESLSPEPNPSFTTLAVVKPTVLTADDATEVAYTTAKVTGKVERPANPDAAFNTSCQFEFVTDAQFAEAGFQGAAPIPCEQGPFTNPEEKASVSANLAGLKPATTYHLRLAAEDGGGIATLEAANTFTTLAVVKPTVLTADDATEVAYTTAKVTGKVERPANPDAAFNTSCQFEFVTDAQFAEAGFQGAAPIPCEQGPFTNPEEKASVSANLAGLKPATTYHLRLAAEDGGGIATLEAANTFTTQTATEPVLALDPPSAVAFTTAHISGTINPEGGNLDPGGNPVPIAWQLEINREGAGWEFAEGGVISNSEPEGGGPIPAEGTDPIEVPGGGKNLEGLQNNAEYKFRLVASYAGLITTSSEGSFKTETVIAPIASVDDASAVTGTTAHFSGHVTAGNADPAFNTSCTFDYVNSTQFDVDGFGSAQSISCAPNSVKGATSTAVAADPSGLQPNTTYHLRLRTENQGGHAEPVAADAFTTASIPPNAQTLEAGGLTSGSARLAGRVNPLNSPTTYQFEWGLTTTYTEKAPVAPEPLGAVDNSFHFFTAPITGLSPGTTYHYRIVATNTQTSAVSHGEDRSFTTLATPAGPGQACPNESSRVGPSAGLPDCRAYELATPDLNDATFSNLTGAALADGSGVLFTTIDAPDQAEGSTVINPVVSRRGPDGWHSQSLSNPLPAPSTSYFSSGITPDSVTKSPLISADFSTYIADSTEPLAGADSPSGRNLYLHRADGSFVPITKFGGKFKPESLTYLPNEVWTANPDFTHIFFRSCVKQLSSDPAPACVNTYEWANGELRLLGILPGAGQVPAPEGAIVAGYFPGSSEQKVLPPVSDDGEEVAFVIIGDPRLYLREHGQNTVEVSATKRTENLDPNPPNGRFIGMTGDGSTVFFTSHSELTDDANTGESGGVASDQGNDLYSYDVVSEALTDLTPDHNSADAATGAGVGSVMAIDPSGSYVYFVATGNLAPGATSGESNLYVEHGGAIDFIGATAGVGDQVQGGSLDFALTPDGKQIAFASADSLTGYDTHGSIEIYKYTYEGALECASCRPDGAAPTGGAAEPIITADGKRVFYVSNDAILPQATNGLQNVYEYEGGQVSLISPGDTTSTTNLLGASASGDDVFLTSHDELTDQGQGPVAAVYDARVEADVAKPVAPECQGESCRGGASSALGASAHGSAKLEAPGEVVAPKSKAAKAKQLKLRVTVPESGQLTVSGKGLKSAKKKVGKAGTVTITLILKSGANKTRLRKGVFKTKAQVLFKPKAGPASTSRPVVALTFEGPTKKGGK